MRNLSTWLASAVLLGAGLLAGPASAGPVSNLGGLQQEANSNVEPVHYRRYSHRGCWRHHGHWHCPRGYRRYAYAYPYYGGYSAYPYYGYGPSIAFSFGGGRHFHGGRHFGGHRFHRGGRGPW